LTCLGVTFFPSIATRALLLDTSCFSQSQITKRQGHPSDTPHIEEAPSLFSQMKLSFQPPWDTFMLKTLHLVTINNINPKATLDLKNLKRIEADNGLFHKDSTAHVPSTKDLRRIYLTEIESSIWSALLFLSGSSSYLSCDRSMIGPSKRLPGLLEDGSNPGSYGKAVLCTFLNRYRVGMQNVQHLCSFLCRPTSMYGAG